MCVFMHNFQKNCYFFKEKNLEKTKKLSIYDKKSNIVAHKIHIFFKMVKKLYFNSILCKNVCFYAQLVKKCYFFKEKSLEKPKIVYL